MSLFYFAVAVIGVRDGGAAAPPPPKKITKSKSRANVQHKSGKSGKLKSQKAPSLLGKQRQSGNIRFTVGQYWLFFWGGGGGRRN
jgi:hypothetical protein